MKKSSASCIIRRIQVTTRMAYLYTSIKIAKIQNTDNTKCQRGCVTIGTLVHCWQECKKVQILWKTICPDK